MKTNFSGADCLLYPASALALVILTSTAAFAQETVIGVAVAKDNLPEQSAESFESPDAGNGSGPATEDSGQQPGAKFYKLDTDDDELLSLREFEMASRFQGNPARARKVFKRRDRDSNGMLTKTEFLSGEAQSEGEGPAGP